MKSALFYLGRGQIGKLLLSDRYEPAFLPGPIMAAGQFLLVICLFRFVKFNRP